ncbi:MAG: NirA family protein [Janthinobacterium lividum]
MPDTSLAEPQSLSPGLSAPEPTPGEAFTGEQQEYLKGFMAGVEARRGALGLPLAPAGGAAPSEATDPADLQRVAQDELLAKGGKLSTIEKLKRARNPLDRWDELEARAAKGVFPKGDDNFLTRWHGLFYVGPTQDAYMCRLRIPGGILAGFQLRGLADMADELAGPFLDCTTRCNLQFREIPAANGPRLLTRLQELGMTARGSGADNIRNVTAPATAGIDPQELLDCRPHMRAMHFHILNHRVLYGLPRKFNIAYDGGGRIPTLEDTNDVGFTAVEVEPGHGIDPGVYYRLALGGITGHRDFARPTGVVLRPDDATRVADAVLRVWIRHGNRMDRGKSRLKYLLDDWGIPKFLDAVEAELAPLTGTAMPPLANGAETPLHRIPEAAIRPPQTQDRHGHLGVHPQKQDGLFYVGVVCAIGRITADQARGLAAVAERFGSGTIRLTVWQNLLVSDIPEAQVPGAIEAIRALGLDVDASHVRAGMIACTGAAGCKFANAHTKQDAAAMADFLEGEITLDQPLNIHITGCHNSCAQHYVGDIGLIGSKVERGEDMVEGYDLHLGGGAGVEQAVGRKIREKVAADEVQPVVLGLLRAWQSTREGTQSFQEWTRARPDEELAALAGGGALPADAGDHVASETDPGAHP